MIISEIEITPKNSQWSQPNHVIENLNFGAEAQRLPQVS
jgi:hypothetical protein